MSDQLYERLLELCSILNFSGMQEQALVDLFYEAYYEGHDSAMLNVARNGKLSELGNPDIS